MGSNLVSNTISILAGASLGAIATYLLDPDQGTQRRQTIADSAGGAVSATSDAVTSHANRLVDAARDVAEKVTRYANDAVDHFNDQLSPGISAASQHAKAAADSAQGLKEDWANRANSMYSHAKSAALQKAHLREAHPTEEFLGHTVGAVGIAVLGAGVMFFMDPAQGKSRRAWVTDKAFSWTRRTGKAARGYGRHLGNQFQGASHDLKQAVPASWSNVADKANGLVEQAKEAVQPVVDRVSEATK